METSSAGRTFRTVCKLVTVAAVTLVLTPGLACQTRRVTQRSDQSWRTILHAEESPHASARAETLAIDRGGATVVAGSFTGVLRAGRYSIRSVSESAGFVVKIASDGEPQWLARLGTAGLSKRSLALDGAGNAIIAADGYVDRGAATRGHGAPRSATAKWGKKWGRGSAGNGVWRLVA